MGQKTHPLGFRLGITQEHRSAWYANFTQYAHLLEEDDQIRTYLNKLAKSASISDIKINRNGLGDQIQLNIETGRPGALVGENGLGIENLLKNIQDNLYQKSIDFRADNSHHVDSYDEFKQVLKAKGGFIYAHWDGTPETEEKIKQETKATIRCIPLSEKQVEGKCMYSGNPSKGKVIFAKAY